MSKNQIRQLLSSLRSGVGQMLSRRAGMPVRALDLQDLEQRLLFSATPVPVPVENAEAPACDVCTVSPAEVTTATAPTDTDAVRDTTELIVVDPVVDEFEALLDELDASDGRFDVLVLDPDRDGIEQLTEYLDSQSDVTAVHILSHGDSGTLRLARTNLNNDSVAAYAGMLGRWEQALTRDADILIYGCDLADSSDGVALVDSLAILTGADVAASDDTTGHRDLGGDWDLEVEVGDVEAALSGGFQDHWRFVLPSVSHQTPENQVVRTDTGVRFSAAEGNAFQVSTPGTSNNDIEVTVSSDEGFLSLQAPIDLFLQAGDWDGDSTFTIRGTEDEINAALDSGLVLTPADGFTGIATVTITTDRLDGGIASDAVSVAFHNEFESGGHFPATTVWDEANAGVTRGVARSVSAAQNGNYVVVWRKQDDAATFSNIYFELFDRTGASISADQINLPSEWSDHVSVAMRDDGSFIVTWTAGEGVDECVHAAAYTADGQFDKTIWVDSSAGQRGPTVATNADGDFVIAWHDTANGIRLQRFDSDGIAIDSTSVVVTGTSAATENPAVGMDRDRNVLVAFDDASGQHYRRYDGTFGGLETLSTAANAGGASLAMTESGAAVIAWQQSGTGWDVKYQRVASDGTPLDSANDVPSNTSGGERGPSVSIDQTGAFVIAWQENGDIRMRRFAKDGTAGEEALLHSAGDPAANASISMLDDQNAVAAWTVDNSGDLNIEAMRINTRVITVTTNSEAVNGDTGSVYSLQQDDGGAISLVEAIIAANQDPDENEIRFELSGSNVITLTADLPSIETAMIIDGTTDSDFVNSPVIELRDGGGARDGLHIEDGAWGSVIRGLSITAFDDYGIRITDGGGTTVVGTWLGVRPDGTISGNEFANMLIRESSHNRIGGSTAAERNVFAGSDDPLGGDGIYIDGSGAHHNVIRGNYIGMDPTGLVAADNFWHGIVLQEGAHNNTIGGSRPGEGNVISANGHFSFTTRGNGITIRDSGTSFNVVQGNLIGTDALGGGTFGNRNRGISIEQQASENLVGGTEAGQGNTITGSPYGVYVSNSADQNTISGNNLFGNTTDLRTPSAVSEPTMTFAASDAAGTTVAGLLNGDNDTDYFVEFFASADSASPKFFLGGMTTTTDSDGEAQFRFQLDERAVIGFEVVATVTRDDGQTSEFSNAVTVAPKSHALWFSTRNDENSSGITDLPEWRDSEVIDFGSGGLTLDPESGTTSGTIAGGFDLADFGAANRDIRGLHYVTRGLTVGGSPDSIELREGDLLFSVSGGTTLTGTTTSVSGNGQDIFVFRPDDFGNYDSGEFQKLVDSPIGTNVHGIALVEAPDVWVGDTRLTQGTLLLADNGADGNRISMVNILSTGDPGAVSVPQVLIDGDDGNLQFTSDITALHLVQETTLIQGTELRAGDILLSLKNDDTAVGGNSLSTQEQDVFGLQMYETAAGPNGRSLGSAYLLFDGSDAGLNDNTNDHDIVSLTFASGDRPWNISLDSRYVANLSPSAVVGNLTTHDPFPSGPVTYSVSDSRFEVVAGKLRLKSTASLNRLTEKEVPITVTSTDADGHSISRSFTIVVGKGTGLAGTDTNTTLANAPTSSGAPGVLLNDAFTGSTNTPTDGIVLDWDAALNTDGGWWEDSTDVNGFDWVLGSGVSRSLNPTTTRPGILAAYDFDGTPQATAINVRSFATMDTASLSRSFELWVRPDTLIDSRMLFETGAADASGVSLRLDGTMLDFTVFDPTSGLDLVISDDVLTTVTPFEFSQIVGVIEVTGGTTTVSLYVNGVEVGSGSGAAVTAWAPDAETAGLGSIDVSTRLPVANPTANNFFGSMARMRVYDSALTAAEALANYEAVAGNVTNAHVVSTSLVGTLGQATVYADGSYDYDPNGAFDYLRDGETAIDRFGYDVSDGNSTVGGVVEITVIGINDAPTIAIDNGFDPISELAADGSFVGAVSASDPDTGDTLSYSLQNDYGGLFAVDAAGTVTVNDSSLLDAETTQSYALTIIVSDDAAVSQSDSVNVVLNIIDENEDPISAVTDSDTDANLIAEDAATGTPVQVTAFATDPDITDDVTYFLDVNPGSLFAIDSSSGVITLAGSLDYETTQSYLITVRARSDDGSETTADFTINVGDVNDNKPVVDSGLSFTVSESAPVDALVGTVTALDVDTVGSLQGWAITGGNADGAFKINAGTGEITINDSAALDFETAPIRTLQVTVSDGVNTSDAVDVVVNLTDTNDTTPVVDPGQAFVVSELAANGTVLGTVTATDPDTVGMLQNWQIVTGDPNGIFRIDAMTGVLSVNNGALLDFESRTRHTLTIRVRDGVNQGVAVPVVIDVTDENENPPVIAAGQSFTVSEDAGPGVSVGTISASDIEDDATIRNWQIVGGNDDGIFAIDASSGLVTVADPAALDYETTTSHTLVLTVDDEDFTSLTETVTIDVSDVDDEPPVIAAGQSFDVLEDAKGGFVPGTIAASDVDTPGPVNSWQLVGAASAQFEIDATSGEVRLAADAALDYESKTTYVLMVRASDGIQLSLPTAITINVLDVDENPPVIPGGQQFTLSEDALVDDRVGQVVATDETGLQDWTIVGGNEDAIFRIVPHTGRIVVRDTANLDFETTTSYSLSVTVSDGAQTSDPQTVLITITGVNDNAPVFQTQSSLVVNEGVQGAFQVVATDADAPSTTVTYSLSGADAAVFRINAATGRLRFRNAPDFETPLDVGLDNTYQFTIIADDNDGQSSTQDMTVVVSDINDTPPVVAGGQSFFVSETAGAGRVLGTIAATDVDTTGESLTFELVDDHDGLFVLDSSGRLSVGDPSKLNFEVTSDYELRVKATDGKNVSAEVSVTVQVLDQNEAPTNIRLPSNTVAENSPGATVGTLLANDPDVGDSHVYSTTDTRFEIVGNELRLRAGVSLDFEAASETEVEITATDAGGLSFTRLVVVQILNTNDAPTSISLSGTIVSENEAGAIVGMVSTMDQDAGDEHTYSVDDSRFVVTSQGRLKLRNTETLDFEAEPEIRLAITATDTAGDTFVEFFDLNVADTNDAPTTTGRGTDRVVMEDTDVADVRLDLHFSDEDAGDQFTYRIVQVSNGSIADFEISGKRLLTTLRENATGSTSVRVRATDTGGESAVVELTLDVTPVNDAPVAEAASYTILTGTSLEDAELIHGDTDVDNPAGDLVVTLVGAAPENGSFVLNSDGTFSFVPDPEFVGQVAFEYEVSDGEAASRNTATINVTPPVVPNNTNNNTNDDNSTPTDPDENPTFGNPDDGTGTGTGTDTGTGTGTDGVVNGEQNGANSVSDADNTVSAEPAFVIFGQIEDDESDADSESDAGPAEEFGTASLLRSIARRGGFGNDAGNQLPDFDPTYAGGPVIFDAGEQRVLSAQAATRMGEALDDLRSSLASEVRVEQLAVGTATVGVTGLSVGYVVYLLRGGSLFASMLTTLPAWRMVDPLPILDVLDSNEDDEDSLHAMIDRSQQMIADGTRAESPEG